MSKIVALKEKGEPRLNKQGVQTELPDKARQMACELVKLIEQQDNKIIPLC